MIFDENLWALYNFGHFFFCVSENRKSVREAKDVEIQGAESPQRLAQKSEIAAVLLWQDLEPVKIGECVPDDQYVPCKVSGFTGTASRQSDDFQSSEE